MRYGRRMTADQASSAVQKAANKPCHVFIAYRQDDGGGAAEWLHENLQGCAIDLVRSSESLEIETYYDQASPAIGDWLGYWRDKLKVSSAMLLVCTHGSAHRRSGVDRLYEEIDFWVKEKGEAPIIIEASDADADDCVPAEIAHLWPDAQRLRLVPGLWNADDSPRSEPRLVERILAGIRLSTEGIHFEELERLRRLNDELKAQMARFHVESSKRGDRLERVLHLAEAAVVAPSSAIAAPFVYEAARALADDYVIDRVTELGERPSLAPDGTRVIDWVDRSTARLMDPFNKRRQRRLRHAAAGRLNRWDTTGVITRCENEVYLWNPSGTPTCDSIPGRLVTVIDSGDRLIIQQPDGAVAVYDRTGDLLFATRSFDAAVRCVKLVDQGRRLLAAFPELFTIDLEDGVEHLVRLRTRSLGDKPPWLLRFSSTGAYVVGLIGKDEDRNVADAAAVWRLDGTAATEAALFETTDRNGIHSVDLVGDHYLAIEWWSGRLDARRRGRPRAEDRRLELHRLGNPDAEVLHVSDLADWSITHHGRAVHAVSANGTGAQPGNGSGSSTWTSIPLIGRRAPRTVSGRSPPMVDTTQPGLRIWSWIPRPPGRKETSVVTTSRSTISAARRSLPSAIIIPEWQRCTIPTSPTLLWNRIVGSSRCRRLTCVNGFVRARSTTTSRSSDPGLVIAAVRHGAAVRGSLRWSAIPS